MAATEANTETDFWDCASPILIFDSFRTRQVPTLAAAIITCAVLVADAIRATKAES